MIGRKVVYTDRIVLFSYTFLGYLAMVMIALPLKETPWMRYVLVLGLGSLLFLVRWSRFKRKVCALASWKSKPNRRLLSEVKWGAKNGVLFFSLISLVYSFSVGRDQVSLLLLFFLLVLCLIWGQFVNFGAEMLHLLGNIRKTQRRVNQEKSEVLKIKQEVLQDLISPHFLFNSLNTISTFISENSTESIRIVKELSDLYGFMLNNSNKSVVLLEEDLSLAKKYAYLLEKRFENSINITFDVPKRYNYCLIPPMTLQNLVENCVKHNIVTRKSPLNIAIFVENDYLVVKNNLNLKMNSGKGSTSIGLSYIQSQVEQMIDKKVIIEQSTSDFVVKIPLIYHVNIKIDESINH